MPSTQVVRIYPTNGSVQYVECLFDNLLFGRSSGAPNDIYNLVEAALRKNGKVTWMNLDHIAVIDIFDADEQPST